MKQRSPKLATAAIKKQLALVDKMVAAPSPSHPLWDMVEPKTDAVMPNLPPGQAYG